MKSLGLLVFLSLSAACIDAFPAPALIPRPVEMRPTDGVFKFDRGTRIVTDENGLPAAHLLAERLAISAGFQPAVEVASERTRNEGSVVRIIATVTDQKFGPEEYELVVTPQSVVVRSTSPAGAFYGAQTLLQLLPPAIFARTPNAGANWEIPAVRIKDAPRFKWRGMMADVSRHFFTTTELKRMLDLMAMHKLNTFHWHLVDNEGWRIEIKKYPRLTEVGGWRDGIGWDLDPKASTAWRADGKYGGYYTQEEIREIVAYAQERNIAVIPEIEMPGHSLAALRAYPKLGCLGGPHCDKKGAVIEPNVFCAGDEHTFEFIENVLTEVFALFPSHYVHIGGDEVSKVFWHDCPRCQARMRTERLGDEHELQSYFIRRAEKFIASHGRTLIGWSEIREGGLAESAVVMDWIGGGLESAQAGHEVVMTNKWYCYLNYLQVPNPTGELRPTNRFLPLNRVFAFEPIPAQLAPERHHLILGGQGNLWAEHIPSLAVFEYQAFPRLSALAEVLWSPKAPREWDDFMNRLEVHVQRLEAAGVNYYRGSIENREPDPFAPWPPPVEAQ